MRLMKVVLVVSALFVLCNVSLGQLGTRQVPDTDRGRVSTQEDQKQKQYQKGMRDGQEDGRNKRPARPRSDEKAYVEGYRAGYGQAVQGQGGGARLPDAQSSTANIAFQEGLRHGQEDGKDKRPARPRRDDKAYLDGYRAGYGQAVQGQGGGAKLPDAPNAAFQEGLRDGQEDGKGKRALRPRRDNKDYLDGYRAGYGQAAQGQGGAAQRPDAPNAAFQEGLRDGQEDGKGKRALRPRRDNKDYLDGYRAGYGQATQGQGGAAQLPNAQRDTANAAFQEGLRDGQDDRKNKRAARLRRNDRAYVDGYRAGYGQ